MAADATATNSEVQLASDTVRKTADGASFTAPAGWWIETRGKAVILRPEGDSRLALVDVHETNADTAVAWSRNGRKLCGYPTAARGRGLEQC